MKTPFSSRMPFSDNRLKPGKYMDSLTLREHSSSKHKKIALLPRSRSRSLDKDSSLFKRKDDDSSMGQ